MKSVLISGGRSPYTLELCRIFKKNKFKVYVVEFFSNHLCHFSNQVDKSYIITAPNINFELFTLELVQVVKSISPDLLIPTNEEVFHIAKIKTILENYTEVFCDSFDKLIQLHCKFKFIKILELKKVRVPQTYLMKDYTNKFQNKSVIIKKKYSRFGCQIVKVHGRNLPALINTRFKHDSEDWIVQEQILGVEISIYVVVFKGHVQALSAYKKSSSVNGGASVYFEAFEHKGIDEFVHSFFYQDTYHGQYSFDLMLDDLGCIYPIECNPRSTSGIHLFSDSLEFTQCFFHKTKRLIPKSGKNYMILLPMLMYGAKSQNFFTWIKRLINSKDVIFKLGDLKPALFQFLSFSYFIKIAIINKISVLEATTQDIEHN